MQITELGLGNSATDASVWKTTYEYGELQANGTVDTTKNTGNIARQTLTVPGTSFVQSYKYDSLYRLTEVTEKTGSTTNWSQEFSYDRYGNRIGIDQLVGSLTLNTTPSVDVNTNRFSPSQGFTYDKNGNIINDVDPVTTLGRQFIFNGDNKQVEVKLDGVTIGRYYYDGEGKRVKKVTNQETTVFVYSSGKLIAEYSTQMSQTPQTKYLTEDHLGTPRIITNELGQVVSRRDFMPFGEELYNGVGARSENLKYGTNDDDVKQRFTGYQKDNETGLDFAEARMYANEFGRFTAVDPLLASGKSSHPQTFNRFVYTGNNPITRTDPTGEDWIVQITQVKIKERAKVRGRIRTVEKTIDVRTPVWVSPDDAPGVPRVTGVWGVNFNGNGFQALHPVNNIASDVFSTREQAETQYNEWLLNDSVKFIDTGQGLPSELPENKEAIRTRLSFMLNSGECSNIMKEIGRPTLSQVLTNRGLTIADPEILRNPNSVSVIGDGFTDEARRSGLNSLNDGSVQAFTLRPEPYDSQPRGRVFTFFKPSSFQGNWFGFGASRLDENVPHEVGIHGAGVGGFRRPTFLGQPIPYTHDLSSYPRYTNIINACTPR